jgi:hypothetical protein
MFPTRESVPLSSGCATVPFGPQPARRRRPFKHVVRVDCPTGARQSGAGGGGGEVGSIGRSSPAPFDPDLGLAFRSVFSDLTRSESSFSFSFYPSLDLHTNLNLIPLIGYTDLLGAHLAG